MFSLRFSVSKTIIVRWIYCIEHNVIVSGVISYRIPHISVTTIEVSPSQKKKKILQNTIIQKFAYTASI